MLEIPELEDFLNAPNPSDSFEELVCSIAVQQLVFGVCYLEVQRQGLDATQARGIIQKSLGTGTAVVAQDFTQELEDLVQAAVVNGIPTGMQVLPAQQIEVLGDKFGNVLGFKQTTDDARIINFKPEEVLVLLYPGSMDKFYGDSPLEPISSVITNDTLISQHQQSKLMNYINCQTIVSLPENTSDADVERFHEQFMENYAGPQNAGKSIITPLATKIEHLDTTNEGDYLKLREWYRDTIAHTFGVPLSLLGTNEGSGLNGAGSVQQYRNFVHNTCWSQAMQIQRDVNRYIIEPFEQLGAANIMLKLKMADLEDNEQQETIWNLGLNNGSLTINEVRKLRGTDPVEGGDEAYVNAKGVQVVSQLGQAPAAPLPNQANTEANQEDDDETQKQLVIREATATLKKLRKAL